MKNVKESSNTEYLLAQIIDAAITVDIPIKQVEPQKSHFTNTINNHHIIEYLQPGDTGLLEMQRVTLLGPGHFGSDWDWKGGWKKPFQSLIPDEDLPILLECLRRYRRFKQGETPPGYMTAERTIFGPLWKMSAANENGRRIISVIGTKNFVEQRVAWAAWLDAVDVMWNTEA